MGKSDLEAWAPRVLSVLRIVAALLFMVHGSQKLFGVPAIPQQPPVMSVLWIGALIELFGGLLVLLGLFTRPAAFLMSGQMAVAYWGWHAPKSFWPALNGGDAAILFCFLFLYLVFAGPGSWSLDARRGAE